MDLENILPIFIPIVGMMIPIIVILTKHQQKMAEFYATGKMTHDVDESKKVAQNSTPSNEMYMLREEVRQLRELSAQQTIAFDSLQRAIASSANDDLKQRIGENQ